jgi:hypothetical protein
MDIDIICTVDWEKWVIEDTFVQNMISSNADDGYETDRARIRTINNIPADIKPNNGVVGEKPSHKRVTPASGSTGRHDFFSEVPFLFI